MNENSFELIFVFFWYRYRIIIIVTAVYVEILKNIYFRIRSRTPVTCISSRFISAAIFFFLTIFFFLRVFD